MAGMRAVYSMRSAAECISDFKRPHDRDYENTAKGMAADER